MSEEIAGFAELIEYLRNEGITSCILYGSAADRRMRADSDIDLAVASDTALDPETLARHYLKSSSLLQKNVDLRDLRRAKGLYLKEVLTGGRILLNDDPQFLGNKAIEMMDYQTDLAPQVNAIREKLLMRKLHAE